MLHSVVITIDQRQLESLSFQIAIEEFNGMMDDLTTPASLNVQLGHPFSSPQHCVDKLHQVPAAEGANLELSRSSQGAKTSWETTWVRAAFGALSTSFC